MRDAICYSFSYIVEAIILLQYTSTLFTSKQNTKKTVVLASLYFILFLFSLFKQPWINAILFLIANFIFIATQYMLKWYWALFHSSVIIAIMGMCELIVYGVIAHYTPHFFARSSYSYNLAILTIFSKTIYCAILYILLYFFKGKQKHNQQNDTVTIVLGIIPLTSIFVMLTLLSISEVSGLSSSFNCWMVVLSALFLLVINLLVFGINQYNELKSVEVTDMQLLLQKESDSAEYYKMLSKQNENQSILIHDIKKHLQSIALLNSQKEHDKITSYIEQLMLSSDLKENSRLCNYEILNAILCRYHRQCEQRHISFHTDIRNKSIDFLSDNDTTSLFCNLLDNALEAATHIPQSYIDVNVGKRNNTSITVITITNSCRTDPFSGNNKQLLSQKHNKAKHGFGLKSIRKIVQKYNGNMEMYYNNDSSTFHTIIILKN